MAAENHIHSSKMESHRHWIEINQQKLHYQQAGAGSPVVLVHGLLGGSFCWRFNIPALSGTHSVFAVDLPGFGLADASRETDCGMQAQALRLHGLIEQLQLDSVDVVASSWGGAVALFLAARSRKVRSLVLAAPVNPWSDFGMERIRFLAAAWVDGCCGWQFLFRHLCIVSRCAACTAILSGSAKVLFKVMRPCSCVRGGSTTC